MQQRVRDDLSESLSWHVELVVDLAVTADDLAGVEITSQTRERCLDDLSDPALDVSGALESLSAGCLFAWFHAVSEPGCWSKRGGVGAQRQQAGERRPSIRDRLPSGQKLLRVIGHAVAVDAELADKRVDLLVVDGGSVRSRASAVVGARLGGEHLVDLRLAETLVRVADANERPVVGAVLTPIGRALTTGSSGKLGRDHDHPGLVLDQRDAGTQRRLDLRACRLQRASDAVRVLHTRDVEGAIV